MKFLLIALPLLSLPALADDKKPVYPGDQIVFTRDVVFSNAGHPQESTVQVSGTEHDGSLYVRCTLLLDVPANSKWTVKAGRSLKVFGHSYGTLGLEGGVKISCRWARFSTDQWQPGDGASSVEFGDIRHSLPMLRIRRQNLPPPNDKEL